MERRMDQWDLVIKVKHGDTLRRIGAHVHGQLMDLNMSKLRSKVISLFKISHGDELILSYTDEDGDVVTLDDDDELRDAVIGQRLNPLRINVQVKSPDSSDARPERLSPSSSVNAPRPVVIPTLVEQENTILDDIELPSDMTRSVSQIPNENRSGNVVVQGAGVMSPSVDRNVQGAVAKNGKASLYPIDDLLASIYTANNFPEHAHEEEGCNTYLHGKSGLASVTAFPPTNQALHGSRNYWTPLQRIPINMDGSAGIMDGGCNSKQTSMKADLSSPSQTVFNSHAKVPISGTFGTIADADHLKRFLRMSGGRMPMGVHMGVQCDKCGMLPIAGPRFKSNVKEDYDLCNICFTQMGNETDYTRIDHAHPSGRRMLTGFHNHHARICQRTKLESRFIRDVTVLDGTVMPPSTHFTKIWRMRNNGSVPWPIGTQLVWVGGDQFGDRVSAHLEIPQLGIPVDKELDIAVDFTAPSRPGRYVSYWRMASPYGKKFGQRVWVLIQVDCSRPNSAAGTSFHPRLNLNLPPESNGGDRSVNIDEDRVERAVEDVSGGHVEQPAPVAGGLDASNDELSQPSPVATTTNFWISPLELLSDASFAIAVTAGDGKHVEQTLLKEREEMFKAQIERNKEILRRNDLCGYAEWDPLLSELKEMGFNDKELNKKLMMKNGGSIKRTVLDLIAGKASE